MKCACAESFYSVIFVRSCFEPKTAVTQFYVLGSLDNLHPELILMIPCRPVFLCSSCSAAIDRQNSVRLQNGKSITKLYIIWHQKYSLIYSEQNKTKLIQIGLKLTESLMFLCSVGLCGARH